MPKLIGWAIGLVVLCALLHVRATVPACDLLISWSRRPRSGLDGLPPATLQGRGWLPYLVISSVVGDGRVAL